MTRLPATTKAYPAAPEPSRWCSVSFTPEVDRPSFVATVVAVKGVAENVETLRMT